MRGKAGLGGGAPPGGGTGGDTGGLVHQIGRTASLWGNPDESGWGWLTANTFSYIVVWESRFSFVLFCKNDQGREGT